MAVSGVVLRKDVFAAIAAADFSRGFQPTERAIPSARRVSDARVSGVASDAFCFLLAPWVETHG